MIGPPTPNNEQEDFPVVGDAEVQFDREVMGVEFPSPLLAGGIPPETAGMSVGAAIAPHPPDPVEALMEVVRTQITNDGVPSVEMAAEITNSSRRTFQRQLREAGLDYRRLVNRVRFSIARDSLSEDRSMPLDEVAKRAGFSNARPLIRSVRSMAGMTPGQYRNLHLTT